MPRRIQRPPSEHPPLDGSVEFLVANDERPVPASAESVTRSAGDRALLALGAVAGALVVGMMVLPAGTEEATAPTSPVTVGTTFVPEPEPAPPAEESSEVADAQSRLGQSGHDPYILGVPGPGEPLSPSLIDYSLVYVNTAGRATVFDLTTGDREEVEVSPERDADRFLLEFGHVVTSAWGSDNRLRGSGRSIEINLHRTVDSSSEYADQRAQPEPVLCLDTGGCVPGRSSAPRLSADTDSVVPLEIGLDTDRVDVIADVLGVAVELEGRWLVASDFRIPAPLDTTSIWLVHQPRNADAS